MKCKFCDKKCYPTEAAKRSESYSIYSGDYRHGDWMCFNHPSPVRYEGKSKRFSICSFFNQHWYEFAFNPYVNCFILYCLDDYVMFNYERNEDDQTVMRILVKDLPDLPVDSVTPENAADKLAMILSFL